MLRLKMGEITINCSFDVENKASEMKEVWRIRVEGEGGGGWVVSCGEDVF